MNLKLSNLKSNDEIKNILLAVVLLMGFIFFILVSIFYIREQYSLVCSCKTSLLFIIGILTSLGIFVGILTYYFISNSYSKEKQDFFKNVEKTLNFLDLEEKTIISTLINEKGDCPQNKLSQLTKIDAVKLHRKLNNLESKYILHKVKKGMTNTIVLNEEFKEIFIN